jgi:putative redox protein
MVKSETVYLGHLHCEITHAPSHSKIATDAPKDNNGKGEAFSPTDLVGAALGSCILTTMAMVADRDGVNIEGAHAQVEKEMSANPRRIETLRVNISLPATIPAEYRPKLERIAHACPVHKSLHPEIQIPVTFTYG